MSALDELIAAVEGGTAVPLDFDAAFEGAKSFEHLHSRMAYHGKLDHAKALHDALLPGWVARPQIGGPVTVWHCTLEDWDSGEEIEANNMPDPARAWLLAILRALRAKGGAQ